MAMTTTAEKIKVMQAFQRSQPTQWRGRLSDAEWKDVGSPELSWNWEMNEYRIKPPDPEPLECQDEQDRKDAARLKWLLEEFEENYGTVRLDGDPTEYRSLIDKAMEGE